MPCFVGCVDPQFLQGRIDARKLSKNLTFKFERREHQLTGQGKGCRLRGASATVCKGFDGSVGDGKDVRQRVDKAKAA